MSTLQIPAIGWMSAVSPCTECLRIVAHESRRNVYAGQQHDCYDCQNRLTVQRIVQDGPAMTRTEAVLADDSIFAEKKWTVVEVAFDDTFTSEARDAWMLNYGMEGFQQRSNRLGWAIFNKEANSEASVLVLLDDGVVGRCLLDTAD